MWSREGSLCDPHVLIPDGGSKEQSGSCQWCPGTGKLAMGMICNPGTWGTWLKHLKIIFCCEGGWTLKRRGFWVSISRDIQTPRGHNPEKSALADPWAGAWTRSSSEVPSKLIYSSPLLQNKGGRVKKKFCLFHFTKEIRSSHSQGGWQLCFPWANKCAWKHSILLSKLFTLQ